MGFSMYIQKISNLSCVVACCFIISACSRDNDRADASDANQVAAGKGIYAAQCARCHGEKLEGQPDWRTRKADGKLPAPPHDETGHTWHHADKLLFGIVKHGMVPPYGPEGYLSDMPSFGGQLSDEDIWAVLAFIKSTWPDQARQVQEKLNRQGAQR